MMRQLGCHARQLFVIGIPPPTIESLFEGDQGYYVNKRFSPRRFIKDRIPVEAASFP